MVKFSIFLTFSTKSKEELSLLIMLLYFVIHVIKGVNSRVLIHCDVSDAHIGFPFFTLRPLQNDFGCDDPRLLKR